MQFAKPSDILVSVVIPCRNEVKHIEDTVHAVLASDHQNVEVLVVDGLSTDGTQAVIDRLVAQDSRVRRIDNPKMLTPYARNCGIRASKGQMILVCDSRNVIDQKYISTMRDALVNRPDLGCAGGEYRHISDSEAGRFISLAMESKFGMGVGNYRTVSDNSYVDTVGVPMYWRKMFDQVGFFDEDLTRNQDDEFNFRVRKKGLKVVCLHAARVTYLVRPSLRKAFQQFRQYGYFKVLVNRKHNAITTLRQVIPSVFVAFWISGLPFSFLVTSFQPVLALVASAYLLLGLMWAGAGLSVFERLRVVLTCFVLHWGYGVGYWEGIWDFLVRQKVAPNPSLQRQTT